MHFRNSFAYIFAYLAAKTFLKYISMEKETYVNYGEWVEDDIQLIRRFSLSQTATSSDVLGTHNSQNAKEFQKNKSQNSKTPWEFWEMSFQLISKPPVSAKIAGCFLVSCHAAWSQLKV